LKLLKQQNSAAVHDFWLLKVWNWQSLVNPKNPTMKFNNVLHIDDDPDDLELFAEALKGWSFATYHAVHSPIDALKKLESEKLTPDIIFVDLNMPLMDGMEFLQKIKAHDQLKNIPVIVLSTCSGKNSSEKAKALGAHAYITKPHNFKKLQAILQMIL
jgi:CheY-like chemotaxis protein